MSKALSRERLWILANRLRMKLPKDPSVKSGYVVACFVVMQWVEDCLGSDVVEQFIREIRPNRVRGRCNIRKDKL